jgi:hypothetical protein
MSFRVIPFCFQLFRRISKRTEITVFRLKIPRYLVPWGFDPPLRHSQNQALTAIPFFEDLRKGRDFTRDFALGSLKGLLPSIISNTDRYALSSSKRLLDKFLDIS